MTGSASKGLRGRAAPLLSLVVVSLVALVAAALLCRVQSNAVDIRSKTGRIAESARGINEYTDAIVRLDVTNALAASILNSVDPLADPVAQIRARSADIADIMRSIKGSTSSINGSTRSINASSGQIRDGLVEVESSAAAIRTTLGGVNADAAGILQVLALIQRGVALLGSDLETTAEIVAAILADVGGISGSVVTTDHFASCIDNGLNGNADCVRGSGP
jgi:methyl-accepting chemotaxis protein